MELEDRAYLRFIIPFYQELMLHDFPVVGETRVMKELSETEKEMLEVLEVNKVKLQNVKFIEKFNEVRFTMCGKYPELNIRMNKVNPSTEFLERLRKIELAEK